MTAQSNLSPVKSARRAKIVALARALFVERGFRATTMEGIAEAARMSKVTIYGYFPDKDAVFRAVSEDLAAEMEGLVREALDREGAPSGRIADALVAKHALTARVVRGSAHAQDLFAARDRTAAAIFDALDLRIEAAIANVLRSDGLPDAARIATLVFASAQGVANRSANRADMERDVRWMVKAVIEAAT